MNGTHSRFRAAVQQTHPIATHYRPGLHALEAVDRQRLECRDARRLTGSLYLDAAKAATEPNANRWDYGIGQLHQRQGREERIVWIEVHGASGDRFITEVLQKLEWLKGWLAKEGAALNYTPREFIWIASGKSAFPGNAPALRKLSALGLKFVGRRFELR